MTKIRILCTKCIVPICKYTENHKYTLPSSSYTIFTKGTIQLVEQIHKKNMDSNLNGAPPIIKLID